MVHCGHAPASLLTSMTCRQRATNWDERHNQCEQYSEQLVRVWGHASSIGTHHGRCQMRAVQNPNSSLFVGLFASCRQKSPNRRVDQLTASKIEDTHSLRPGALMSTDSRLVQRSKKQSRPSRRAFRLKSAKLRSFTGLRRGRRMSASIVGGSVHFDRRVNDFEVGRDQQFILIWRFRIVTDYGDLCRINAMTDTPNM